MKTKSVGFIGGGNMAASLISGLIESGHDAAKIWVSDINDETLQHLSNRLNVNVSANNETIIVEAEIIVLAVKPQVLKSVAQQMAQFLHGKDVLVISIAAGISQQSLTQWLGNDIAIVRCMPNTPALVLTGATALHANDKVSNDQKNLAENILRAVGLALWVEHECELDAVTAVSGSGPAYFFLLMEAMEKAALELGLDNQTAQLLIQQTALGAAKIALESDDSATRLREKVTSPGGTTEQAINTFQNADFTTLVSKALHAARDRSVELSKELGE